MVTVLTLEREDRGQIGPPQCPNRHSYITRRTVGEKSGVPPRRVHQRPRQKMLRSDLDGRKVPARVVKHRETGGGTGWQESGALVCSLSANRRMVTILRCTL